MPEPATTDGGHPIAVHGIHLRLHDDCELAGTAGNWQRGRLAISRGREAVWIVSWERRQITPDHARTQRRLAARLAGDAMAEQVTTTLSADGGVLSVRTALGLRHAAWRHVEAAGCVVIVRQVAVASRSELTALLQSLSVDADGDACEWTAYGLNVCLPPWWRLHAMEVSAGMARAVWMLRPPRFLRTQAVVVVRRMALADRVLGGLSLGAWIRSRLEPGEQVVSEESLAEAVTIATRRSGPDWWTRLRRRHRERRITAWCDADGRLNVHEFAGVGTPVPPLIHR